MLVQGEGKPVEELAGWFGLGWHFAGDCYRRTDFEFNEGWEAFDDDWYVGPDGRYNVKTLMLSGVKPEHKVYRVMDGAKTHSPVPSMAGESVENDMCPVALARCGFGHLGFVGDVNAEETTLAIISALAMVPAA